MDNNNYKVIADNFGEYSVLTKDNELIVTEIQNKVTAEIFCDKLNELHAKNNLLYKKGMNLKSENKALIIECKEYRQSYDDLNRKINKLIRLCEEFNIDWQKVIV